MHSMFYDAIVFNQPLNFDTSRVTTMGYMFNWALAFNQPLVFDVSEVGPLRPGGGMLYMFNSAVSLSYTNKLAIFCAWEGTSAFTRDIIRRNAGKSWPKSCPPPPPPSPSPPPPSPSPPPPAPSPPPPSPPPPSPSPPSPSPSPPAPYTWFDSSEHCSTSEMQSFGWTTNVGAPYSTCGGGYYYFWLPSAVKGDISIPLPMNFSHFTIEYGQSCYGRGSSGGASVNIQLNGVVMNSVDRTCAAGTSYANSCVVVPPVESCLKTFSMKYSPGDVLSIQEVGTSVAYIKTIKVVTKVPVILEGSTAGYRCSPVTMINTEAECQAAASALGLTWKDANADGNYQDGCSVYSGTNVHFNTQTRVNGGPCVHARNGDTSDGSCNHKSICH